MAFYLGQLDGSVSNETNLYDQATDATGVGYLLV
jgi:hypothetical protein